MRKILITGITGMLGTAIAHAWEGKVALFGTASRPLDTGTITHYPFVEFGLDSSDYRLLSTFCEPEIIIHCAAITNHDLCEKNPEYAYLINAESLKTLAKTFPAAYIIHISTDAVFGRDAVFPDENFTPTPFSVYGKTKYAGERLLLQSTSSALVLRTTVVGSGGRRANLSLAEWIIRSLRSGKRLNLFDDALFTPISAWDLISVLEWCVAHRPLGILHAAGAERISKYNFGVALAHACALNTSLISRGRLAGNPNAAGRRFDQSLSSKKLEQLRGIPLPGVGECVAGIARGI